MVDEMTVHVLWYRYFDGSGAAVVRAYLDPQRAKEDLDLLASVEDGKEFALVAVPLYGDHP